MEHEVRTPGAGTEREAADDDARAPTSPRSWRRATPASDAELLEAWRAGDSAAGSALFDRHVPGLLRFFERRAGERAEDLVQETLLSCVRNRDHFAGRSTFRTYLFGIAWRVLHRSGRGARLATTSELDAGVVPDPGGSPSSAAARERELELLLDAVITLAPAEQYIIGLYFWDERTGPEVARALEIPEPAMRSRLRRALDRLRHAMPPAEA